MIGAATGETPAHTARVEWRVCREVVRDVAAREKIGAVVIGGNTSQVAVDIFGVAPEAHGVYPHQAIGIQFCDQLAHGRAAPFAVEPAVSQDPDGIGMNALESFADCATRIGAAGCALFLNPRTHQVDFVLQSEGRFASHALMFPGTKEEDIKFLRGLHFIQRSQQGVLSLVQSTIPGHAT